ncbi:RlpA-like lipoprotein [Orchesella cincta]|uniref:RlpA-like lipoprotein n=1 Tax=Orchesella cincta TaxID=48709 RepID=A0A1D2M1L0_ORCCI|nr:RlpA-like lipoprotein [Orchesella cincta]
MGCLKGVLAWPWRNCISLLPRSTWTQPGGGRPGGESGECSWYGAEGEIPPGHIGPCNTEFNRFALEVAHKTLPCGTRLRVRNKNNGRTVDVKVADRGPFVAGRILDLTYEAFGRVENRDRGTFPCDYEIL